jgi:hypothetical protein
MNTYKKQGEGGPPPRTTIQTGHIPDRIVLHLASPYKESD